MFRILFLMIASLGVLAALGTVLARNLVHAALFLVAFFFVVACQFVLLEAEFLAAIQVLVYIGAVAILILFGIMLTRNIQGDETTGGRPLRLIPAVLVAIGLLGMLLVGINRESGLRGRPPWSTITARPDAEEFQGDGQRPVDVARAESLRGLAPVVGVEMMTRYVVAFEVAGLLLTAAVVGAIALSVGHHEPRPPGAWPDPGRDTTAGGNGDGDGASPISDEPPTRTTSEPITTARTPR